MFFFVLSLSGKATDRPVSMAVKVILDETFTGDVNQTVRTDV